MTNILLISEDKIKSNTSLPDNIWGKMLLPAIRESQDIFLQAIIGSCLYQSILSMVDNNTIGEPENAAYKELLDDYIQPYLMYRTISNLIPILGTKISNLGTVVSNDEHVTNLSQTEREDVEAYYAYRSDFYCERMQKYLLDNKQHYIELDECACNSMSANLKSAASTGLWLGGFIGRRIR